MRQKPVSAVLPGEVKQLCMPLAEMTRASGAAGAARASKQEESPQSSSEEGELSEEGEILGSDADKAAAAGSIATPGASSLLALPRQVCCCRSGDHEGRASSDDVRTRMAWRNPLCSPAHRLTCRQRTGPRGEEKWSADLHHACMRSLACTQFLALCRRGAC